MYRARFNGRIAASAPSFFHQSSAVDPHHVDADPDSTYHADADPDVDPDPDFFI